MMRCGGVKLIECNNGLQKIQLTSQKFCIRMRLLLTATVYTFDK
jgi:hypothetical protein